MLVCNHLFQAEKDREIKNTVKITLGLFTLLYIYKAGFL